MYVCICKGVTDHDIRALAEGGAASVAEVMRCTGAGTKCGSCRPTIAAVLAGAGAPAVSAEVTALGHADRALHLRVVT